ncbi:MAG TPA: cytochrome d ubiquinol oxidase subunit II [Candidatus Dormibacteraeota bacterium]|nr:cytochrome d ubiquinol oxidase subunit II [Candidatus Dormibacteraeota bacterium]
MATIWFCLVSLMLAVYVVLDGFDLGAGILHLLVARTPEERRSVIASIGPVWDGNEVWLLAAGGTLYLAFPVLYASSFSGFYLPLIIVLWLLVLRGTSIEFRGAIESPVWIPFWDVIFGLSSFLLALFFGAALGNVVRGVPLDAGHRFFEPLWTNFRVGAVTGILDWYTVLVGLAAVAALALHGSFWVALKTEGAIEQRALALARPLWGVVVLLTATITVATLEIQPQVGANLGNHPWGYVFPAVAVLGLMLEMVFLGRSRMKAFLASCAYLGGMLTSAAFGLYPYVLPSRTSPAFALTIENAEAPAYGLHVALAWWIVGMILVAAYFTYSYRQFAGKVRSGEGYGHD